MIQKETAVQVVLSLDVQTIIPEDDSVRRLMRMAERTDYTKLSGAYKRVNTREATPKRMLRRWSWDTWRGRIPPGKQKTRALCRLNGCEKGLLHFFLGAAAPPL